MEIIGALGFITLSIVAYNRKDSINNYLSKHILINKLCPFIICFIISSLLAINLNLSPFNNATPGTDSSVFLYIGKAIYNGAIPYKELFDHKGILLYFIEYFGYLIGFGNQVGVWIVELINLYITTLIFFKIATLFSESRIVCYLSSYIVLHLSSITFFIGEGGNLTEEYALPWISISLYIVIKFFITKEYKRWNIILLGISFTVVFFLRVNMVGLWGALIIAVSVYLLKSKRVSDFFKCSLLFLAGCLLVIVPIILYLVLTDSLKYMIDYYFIFNLSYTGSHSRKGIIFFFFDCLTYAGISSFFIVYSLLINYKNKALWVNFITLLFAYVSAAISGRSYAHYGIILIPFFLLPTVLSIDPFMKKTKAISMNVIKKRTVALVVLFCMLCLAFYPSYRFYAMLREPIVHNELFNYLSSKTTEKDDVLLLGNNVFDYLSSERYTKNKFFYQEPPINVSDKLYNDFISEIENIHSDYIINSKPKENLLSEPDNKDIESNYQKVIAYLNNECEKGVYRLEKYNSFQVYVRRI